MRIACLVNQYPAVSHTFVRREIEALEHIGVTVERFSIRQMKNGELKDERDFQELERTRALLGRGAIGLVSSVLRVLIAHPRRFFNASMLTARIGRRSERGFLRNFSYLAEACVLLEMLTNLEGAKVEHVHAHFGTNSAAVAMLTHVLGGPTYSFTAHGPEEFDKAPLLALREKIDRAAFVVGISDFGRSQLLRQCDASQWSKVHVVRCGLSHQAVTRPPTPVPDVPRFVSVGRICEQKGQLVLIDAAALLVREGHILQLRLVGDGPMRRLLEKRIAALGLQDSVQITGWACGEEVEAEIDAARAFVLPSFAEGLPVVLMEAMNRGRPVISTYVAGIPELITGENVGWLVHAGSVEALADAMREALTKSVHVLSCMGRAGHARVCADHDAQQSGLLLLSLFERYTSTPRPAGSNTRPVPSVGPRTAVLLQHAPP